MKVQKYSSLAQKINADFLCDEGNFSMHLLNLISVFELTVQIEEITSNSANQTENPLMESKEEQELAVGIDEELNEVNGPHAMMPANRILL